MDNPYEKGVLLYHHIREERDRMETQMDMTRGPIVSQLIRFAFPVLLSALLSQTYILVDTVIVSRYLGENALAAITNCQNLAYFITSFLFGIGMGVAVVISQAFGAKNYEWMRRVEHTAIALCALFALLMGIVGMFLSPVLIDLMHTPVEVVSLSQTYLTIYISLAGGQLLYNMAGLGIEEAVGDSKTPLYFLVVSTLINIGLDLLLIVVIPCGIAGAAIATVIAQWISGIGMLVFLMHTSGMQKIRLGQCRLHKDALVEIFRMGIPGAIESSAVSLANAVVQGFVNSFGAITMAATGAFASIEGFGFLPINAFCAALATFTGQNVGAGNEKRTHQGCHFALITMVVISLLIAVVLRLGCPILMAMFTSNPETIAIALQRADITLWFYPILGLTHCLAAILRGAGRPIIPMMAYLGSWGIIRVLILMIVLPRYHELAVLCWVYPITWTISTLFLLGYYCCVRWFPAIPDTIPEPEML